MDRKAKTHLTNEDMTKKFVSSFDLVNYAIKLAENMINTGRDARVKSEVQNRAMLILEEIHEGKDHFDEIEVSTNAETPSPLLDGLPQQKFVFEERQENRKYRTTDIFDSE